MGDVFVVVAEPLERMSGVIVADAEEDVWVAPVEEPVVDESRVVLEVDEPEVAFVRLLKSKKRRLNVVGEGEESEDDAEVIPVIPVVDSGEVSVVPLGPRLNMERSSGLPVGPRLRDAPRVRGWDIVRREYRYVDQSLIGVCHGMVGDSYHTRGGGACAQVRGNFRGGG